MGEVGGTGGILEIINSVVWYSWNSKKNSFSGRIVLPETETLRGDKCSKRQSARRNNNASKSNERLGVSGGFPI